VDTKELEIPETVFVRDVENRVFQGIVLQCLAKIKGITLVEGSFIDAIFNRGAPEGIKGIHAEQDSKHQTVAIRIEVNITYGEEIPKKAEEIQTKVSDEVTKLTGLHVACVHVVFKDVVTPEHTQKMAEILKKMADAPVASDENREEEYTEDF